MEDKIILVDIFDKKIGEIDKMSAHTKPLLHRAFSVFLYHDDKILIQQRAINKYHSGGLWANSCCSHPRANMSFGDSVKERLAFELGIDETVDLHEIFSFTYMTKFDESLYEYEYDHVVVGRYNGNVSPNPDEIMDTKWVSFDDLAYSLEHEPTKYASWFLICAPKVIKYIKEQNKK